MGNETKTDIKKIIACEKSQMLPLNYAMSYRITPIYLLVSLLLIVVFYILMETDEDKYFAYGMICLALFAVITIALLAMVPYVRKKAIATELTLYNFDTSNEPTLETYDFSTDEFSLKFDKFGLYLDGELFYYKTMKKFLWTRNDCNRVRLSLVFRFVKQSYVELPLNPATLKMLQSLQIELDNQAALDYVLSHKKEAFEQIYKTGKIK